MMQIVIELSEDTYKKLTQKSMLMSASAIDEAVDAIKKGRVLPKGHGDLIDRDMCLKMKCRDLVDAYGVTMYAVPTGNILCMKAMIPADKENV